MALCGEKRLFVAKKTRVFTKINSGAKRILWQLSKNVVESVTSDLYIYGTNGQFTPEYIALCKDFYLHM